jgi:DNA-binding response OmpR family regulator
MRSRRKVLLADDDVEILAELEPFLAREGYQVLCARDGEDALRKVASFEPHLMVLDIIMPRLDGREVLRRLRERGSGLPILMLTQVTGADNRIRALNEGADDYIDKPFAPGELLARIEAILRRTCPERPAGEARRELCCGELRVDCQAHHVHLGKRELRLSPKEVGILEYLMRHTGELVDYDTLLEAVWGRDAIAGPAVLYVRVNRLRQALGDAAAHPRFIETVAGLGYRFVGTVEVLP